MVKVTGAKAKPVTVKNVTQRSEDSPQAKDTPEAQSKAAADQFAKADAAIDLTPEEASLSRAAFGY